MKRSLQRPGPHLSLPVTLLLIALAALATLLFGWLGARPLDLTRGPRMAPWRLLMVLAAAVVLTLLVHLVNLAGVETGR